MQPTKKYVLATIALIIVMIILSGTTFAALSTNQKLSTTGSIVVSANMGVFSNSGCTTSLSTINWGSIIPGQNTTQTIYLKNNGTLTLTLDMSTSNWSPAAANNYIAITWHPTSTTLAPGTSTSATITLSVSSEIADITNFNVQISITGTSSQDN
jgi:hypothetical protein